MHNTAYADLLLARHAAFIEQARRADRIAHILLGLIIACGLVAALALFVAFPTV